MNKIFRGSIVFFCTLFLINYASQAPKQQHFDALLCIEDFKQQSLDAVDWYVDSYDTFGIPYNKHDTFFVRLKSVRIQENNPSVNNWLYSIPSVYLLRKSFGKTVLLSDTLFPYYVPARWLFDANGKPKEDVSLEFDNKMKKVNFTVFMPTDIVRELARADNNFFVVMERRKEKKIQERIQNQLEEEDYINSLLRSINSRQDLLLSHSIFSISHK